MVELSKSNDYKDREVAANSKETPVDVLVNLSKDDATKYLLRFVEMFPAAYVFNERFHYYGVLIKTAKPSLLRHFEKKSVKSLRMEERFVSPTLNPR